MEDIIIIVEKFVNDLFSIKDNNIRTYTFANRLKEFEADAIVEMFYIICKRVNQKLPKYQEVFSSLIDIPRITEIVGLPKMSDIYISSRKKGYNDITRLFAKPKPIKESSDNSNPPENIGIEYITLGEKRFLAKSQNKNILDRLLFDSDPIVIKNILINPRTIERDVLKVASRRPISQNILKVIFNDKKWISRYSIKKALIKNPYTPPEVSLALLNFMFIQDLKDISEDKLLHTEVRESAKELIERAISSYPQSLS